MKCFKNLNIFMVPLLLLSCDILRSSPFEVVSWTPGPGVQQLDAGLSLSLTFSHEADRYSVERALSVTEDGLPLTLSYFWDGKTIRLTPTVALRENREYRISLSADAQDLDGLNLESPFEGRFSTRPQAARLRLLSSVPADGGLIPAVGGVSGPLFVPLILHFSHGVSLPSLLQQASFNPPIQGLWSLEDGDTTARFTPQEAWQRGKAYILTLTKDLCDQYDRPMGCSSVIHFSVGEDIVLPRLTGIQILDKQGNPKGTLDYTQWEGLTGPPETPPLTENFEQTYQIVLEFSKPVDPLSVKSRLSFQPSLSYSVDPPYPASSLITIRFTDRPRYGSVYTLLLGKDVKDEDGNSSMLQAACRFLVNGPGSKPPRLAAIRLPLAPGAPGNHEPALYTMDQLFTDFPIEAGSDRYPFDIPTNTWVELYFETALGGRVDLFSLMNSFSVSVTNSCLNFSPRSIINSGFTWADPEAGYEQLERIEIRGLLTNSTTAGLVTWTIAAGLTDSLGNLSGEAQLLPLRK